MKILATLFGKVIPVAALMLLQIALIVLAIVALEIFPLFQLLSALVALGVFFALVNRKETPEFKIPWLILLALFPFFTILAYILFANARIPKKQYERALQIRRDTAACSQVAAEELCEEVKGIESYLRSTAYTRGHMHNRITYYGTGEEFWAALLAELEGAKKYIFMEYFIVDHGKMWDSILNLLIRKAAEGVEVRLMYDDIGTAGMLTPGYPRELKKSGINCRKFNPFRPVVSGIHNNRDHRKITVIDGKTGFTGGINIGDEYVNKNMRLGRWKDTAIKIEGSAVDNLLSMFLQMFDMNEDVPKNYAEYFVEHDKFDDEGYIHPFGDGPEPLYDELVGENNYINLISSAKRYCYIATPYLIPDFNLMAALKNAALRGVDVRIITPHIPDKKVILNMTRSNYSFLLKAGVKIYEYTPGFIHAKMLVSDDEWAFVGTINLDYRSLVHHYECGAVMHKTPCIAEIKADFDDTIAVSQRIPEDFKLSRPAAALHAVLNVFSPLL